MWLCRGSGGTRLGGASRGRRGERDRARALAVHVGAAAKAGPHAAAKLGLGRAARTAHCVAPGPADLAARGGLVGGRSPDWGGIADAAASPTTAVCDRTGASVHS